MHLSRHQNVDFYGDFEGYFKRNVENKAENEYFFEGRIYNMSIVEAADA